MDSNRLTEKTNEALHTAQSEALRRSNQQIDVEHLLPALLSQEGGLPRSMLTRAELAANPYPTPDPPISVTVGGVPDTVSYKGEAPTDVSGLMEVNMQIPPGVYCLANRRAPGEDELCRGASLFVAICLRRFPRQRGLQDGKWPREVDDLDAIAEENR